MTQRSRALALLLTGLLASCASRPEPVAAVAPPPPPPVAMPAGTYPGMPVPTLLADGAYDTPNRALTRAATIWHLRAGLNYAALACRGPAEGAIIAGYNAMLAGQRPLLAEAERTLASEYRATGGPDWRDSYDDAMTRLYNYYALGAARSALCDTAVRVLAEAQGVPAASFAEFAAARLPELDRAYTDVYAAYDAWRAQRPQATYAIAANAPVTQTSRIPWIEVDRAVLRMP